MLFNSLIFLAFAAIFFLFWPIAKKREQVRYAYIVCFSFIFYGWWDWRFLFLVIGTGLVDFLAGLAMVRAPRHRKILLWASMFANIGSLSVFKYSGFLANNISWLLSQVGIDVALRAHIPHFFLILPVGISFYTFQSMSYTIDIYKGHLKPTSNPLHFFAFVSFFPQLVAGPIVRATTLLPQLVHEPHTDEAGRWEGTKLIVHGFAKKILIADNLAYYVAGAFSDPVHNTNSWYWWVIVTAFSFQIYCDFSGYSDIARGLAKWAGYDFPLNFNHPYTATSLRGFWSRWHMSLSTWFRDYVYKPLGGSRGTRMQTELNMWATMLISGLWHGASWTFIIWGALHAASTTMEHFTRWPERVTSIRGGRFLASAFLLVQVWVTWVFFRATSLHQALSITGTMFSFQGSFHALVAQLGGVKLLNLAIIVGIAALRELWFYLHLNERQFVAPRFARPAEISFLALLIVVSVFYRGPGSQFIYFQF